ncbi:MAG: competence protein CoiA family protein [Rhizobiaceae bacterium]
MEAVSALRGETYHCPSPDCGGQLTLKQGRKVAAHFAHKPPYACTWGENETAEHRLAKSVFHSVFSRRNLKCEMEFYTPFEDGSQRRADVLVWAPHGRPVAFEFQKSNIAVTEIEARAFSYAKHGYAQIWIPIAKADFWKSAKKAGENPWYIERYTPGEFEKWISGFNLAKDYWIFDPSSGKLLVASLKKYPLFREGNTFIQDGAEVSNNGYYYNSKRFRTLNFAGPFDVAEFRIKIRNRQAYAAGPYRWPQARMAVLAHAPGEQST